MRTIEGYNNAFLDREMVALFEVSFNISNEKAQQLTSYLYKMGYIKDVYGGLFGNEYVCTVFKI